MKAEKKEIECSFKIQNAENTCSQLVVFDPADLAALRSQFSVMSITHGWRPLELNGDQQAWLFDDTIEVKFTNQGDSFDLKSSVHTPADGEKVLV